MLLSIIKRIVFVICLMYTINIFIGSIGKYLPINIYTITLIYFFDIFAVIAIIFLKYYC